MWVRLLESELVCNLGHWMHELRRGIFVSECKRDVKQGAKTIFELLSWKYTFWRIFHIVSLVSNF